MVVYKYSGSGNDFLIFHTFQKAQRAELAKKICHRHNGIGADGLVVLLPHTEYAYEWEFYNSDGSEAKMCGNASRCAAHYAYHHGLALANHSFLTQAGQIKVKVKDNIVQSNLGKYQFKQKFHLNLEGYSGDWYLLDTGVPHLVHFTDDVHKVPSFKNPTIEQLRKAYNANVNIAYIQDNETIYLSTYERGIEDITLACGTGMAAVFAMGCLYQQVAKSTVLIPPSKERLKLSFEGEDILYEGEVRPIGMCVFNQNK